MDATAEKISVAEAARVFAPICHLDPEGIATGESVATGGQPMRLTLNGGGGGGVVVVVLDVREGALWIEGAAGAGSVDLTRAGLEWIEQTGRLLGCDRVGFQTTRRGLVRKAQRLGYVANGYKLFKGIK